MSTPPVVTETTLPGFKLLGRGKVRDIYDLGDQLLIVATDRLSAFDVVNPVGIPEKGRVLTALSVFWFKLLADLTETHFITDQIGEMGHGLERFRPVLEGRSMLVKKTAPIRVECVVRGYLAGSAWSEYRKSGTVCGVLMPPGLLEASRLPAPLFTPAIKAESGHDENISFEQSAEILGQELASTLRERSFALYNRAAAHALQRGIILADTKFEWGQRDGRLLLIDEVFTPDSSRFWPFAGYQPGRSQPSFDKQPVRDWLESTGWDKTPPAPPLPPDVVRQTTERYLEALRLLTAP
ncbi:MAG TPA: phosphoribosylaminoimidazolesuccinocarboxamide synthase [Planctomycetota bacterium]|nr:phosphoribosylaminoimidazolesuccinocarboxamide synthase [Planctomycetota bacterium]HRR80808.1 phosphoribosylaminoimidazolesuccinocarboxamide synthase [Planctomycetota bacterium]HRT96557.1 phosphoribosylaminoimidazolesuccinocarboxamide synthase [Planctomycetota bacterium]